MIGKVPGCLGAILLFLLPLGVYCQDTVWSMKYNVVSVNHGLRSEINLWNGEVLLAGTLVLKVDSFGTFKWAKCYIREGYIADFLCMTTTYDSCILLAGYIYMPDYVGRNICILKLNRNGEVIWSKAFIIGTKSSAYSIYETEDHGFILAGSGGGGLQRSFRPLVNQVGFYRKSGMGQKNYL